VTADVPEQVLALAEERAAAKAARDFAAADALRERIGGLGFVVTDTSSGFQLTPRPPFEVLPSLDALAALPTLAADATCAVALLVDGWPADVETCVDAIIANAPPGVVVLALDLGNVDGAGLTVHRLALRYPGRVLELHLAATLPQVGWAKAVTALLHAGGAEFVAVMDVSTVLEGDAFTPILAEFVDATVWGSGWRGVDVDLADNWRSFIDGGPGEVDALLGYLLVVRRSVALDVPPNPKARFYRNADMEWSLSLREAGGRLVTPASRLPIRQDRHHGYHDTDPEYRDRESRRTYDRILQRFRGRTNILRPRPA
jgi:hypothetical protein